MPSQAPTTAAWHGECRFLSPSYPASSIQGFHAVEQLERAEFDQVFLHARQRTLVRQTLTQGFACDDEILRLLRQRQAALSQMVRQTWHRFDVRPRSD